MKSESILNVECSMFASAKDTVPNRVNLLAWLQNNQYLNLQAKVRSSTNENEKRIAKESMPSITPSGTFSKRGKNYLLQHSGFIAVDIDKKDNIHIKNYLNLKNELSKLPNVAYCGLSVSGSGYWLLIPIAFPEKHELHFEFIRRYFECKSINIDKACKDVGRLRFYSYDPDAYFNHTAKPLRSFYSLPFSKSTKAPFINSESAGKPVWAFYNECEQFIEVLLNHRWRIHSILGNKTYFTRPGKTSGVSAEYDSSKNVFYVFTANGHPFEANKGYNPFQVFTILEHSGNFSRAGRALIDTNNSSQRRTTLTFKHI